MSVAESNLGQADCYLQVCECVCVSVSYLQEIPKYYSSVSHFFFVSITILETMLVIVIVTYSYSYNLTAKFVFVSQNCGRSAFGIFHMCVI